MSRPKAHPPYHKRDLAAAANANVPGSEIDSESADAGTVLTADGSGGSAFDTIVTTGTYTPTVTAVANLDAAAPSVVSQWTRVGDHVIVSGRLAADPTTAGAVTQLRISLPVTSNIAGTDGLAGSGTYREVGVLIQGDGTNDAAQFTFLPSTTGNSAITFIFMYRIL